MPSQAPAEAATSRKSPIEARRHAQPVAERVAGPGTEDRRPDHQRQPAAGAAPDQDVDRGVEHAHEDAEDERRVEAHADATRTASDAAGRDDERVARRAIRPPPSTTSPSYSDGRLAGRGGPDRRVGR